MSPTHTLLLLEAARPSPGGLCAPDTLSQELRVVPATLDPSDSLALLRSYYHGRCDACARSRELLYILLTRLGVAATPTVAL